MDIQVLKITPQLRRVIRNTDSNSDRDVIPGSFRAWLVLVWTLLDPSVYTSTGPKSNVIPVWTLSTPVFATRTQVRSLQIAESSSGNTATGPSSRLKKLHRTWRWMRANKLDWKWPLVLMQSNSKLWSRNPKQQSGQVGFVSQQPFLSW